MSNIVAKVILALNFSSVNGCFINDFQADFADFSGHVFGNIRYYSRSFAREET